MLQIYFFEDDDILDGNRQGRQGYSTFHHNICHLLSDPRLYLDLYEASLASQHEALSKYIGEELTCGNLEQFAHL